MGGIIRKELKVGRQVSKQVELTSRLIDQPNLEPFFKTRLFSKQCSLITCFIHFYEVECFNRGAIPGCGYY